MLIRSIKEYTELNELIRNKMNKKHYYDAFPIQRSLIQLLNDALN